MRKKRRRSRKATPQGEPPALWMALGSDPGMGKFNWLPVESQWTMMIKSSGEITSKRWSNSDAVAMIAS